MAGLVPAIHALFRDSKKGVDARDERGHDLMLAARRLSLRPHPEEHREAMRLEGWGGPSDLGLVRDRHI